MAKADVKKHFDRSYIRQINYRPFDKRFLFYTGNARGFVGWPVQQVMQHYIEGSNLGFLIPKAMRDQLFAHVFVTDTPSEAIFLSGTTGSNAMNSPLYRYNDADLESGGTEIHRTLNFDPALYARFCEAAGLTPSTDLGEGDGFRRATGADRPAEVQVFDYIYGVLHSPTYRARYAEFLKIDFPRVPLPPSPAVFAHVSDKGEQLRRLHLMEPAAIGEAPYQYVGEGDDVVAKGYPKWVSQSSPSSLGEGDHAKHGGGDAVAPSSVSSGKMAPGKPLHHPAGGPPPRDKLGEEQEGRVHINPDQWFDAVPLIAWDFHIGGYQPAQKWLKDRRGRTLSWEDVSHYLNIVKVLLETDRLMREIVLPLDQPIRSRAEPPDAGRMRRGDGSAGLTPPF